MQNHMVSQLVSHELLQKSNKILFLPHLAIGDYVYLQTFFKAFAQQYPHIKIDVWVDKGRRTFCFWRWRRFKSFSLSDWLNATPFFNKIYDQTYSPIDRARSIKQAISEQYPVVVSLATLRSYEFACLAREISPKGFLVGIKPEIKKYQIFKKRIFAKLDAFISPNIKEIKHITDLYAYWFEQLFNVRLVGDQCAPYIDIPKVWTIYAKLRFLKYGIGKKQKNFGKVFFVNAFAKNKKRDWPLENFAEIIRVIKKADEWRDVSFIVNAPPEHYESVTIFFKKLGFNDVFVCSATENFFQLPAIMSCCDLVISVETSIIHLASALGVPVVALMRQKNPEWAPFDTKNSFIVTTEKRSQSIRAIPWQKVYDITMKFVQERLG
ncbi:MAG: glycosyltransferase family 9 protein [bacterium]